MNKDRVNIIERVLNVVASAITILSLFISFLPGATNKIAVTYTASIGIETRVFLVIILELAVFYFVRRILIWGFNKADRGTVGLLLLACMALTGWITALNLRIFFPMADGEPFQLRVLIIVMCTFGGPFLAINDYIE